MLDLLLMSTHPASVLHSPLAVATCEERQASLDHLLLSAKADNETLQKQLHQRDRDIECLIAFFQRQRGEDARVAQSKLSVLVNRNEALRRRLLSLEKKAESQLNPICGSTARMEKSFTQRTGNLSSSRALANEHGLSCTLMNPASTCSAGSQTEQWCCCKKAFQASKGYAEGNMVADESGKWAKHFPMKEVLLHPNPERAVQASIEQKRSDGPMSFNKDLDERLFEEKGLSDLQAVATVSRLVLSLETSRSAGRELSQSLALSEQASRALKQRNRDLCIENRCVKKDQASLKQAVRQLGLDNKLLASSLEKAENSDFQGQLKLEEKHEREGLRAFAMLQQMENRKLKQICARAGKKDNLMKEFLLDSILYVREKVVAEKEAVHEKRVRKYREQLLAATTGKQSAGGREQKLPPPQPSKKQPRLAQGSSAGQMGHKKRFAKLCAGSLTTRELSWEQRAEVLDELFRRVFRVCQTKQQVEEEKELLEIRNLAGGDQGNEQRLIREPETRSDSSTRTTKWRSVVSINEPLQRAELRTSSPSPGHDQDDFLQKRLESNTFLTA